MNFRIIFTFLLSVVCVQAPISVCADNIIDSILSLESQSDPKCSSTANRFENMLHGVPLSDQSRFLKENIQKDIVRNVWLKASGKASADNKNEIGEDIVAAILEEMDTYRFNDQKDVEVNLRNRKQLIIPNTPYRQYASIAYSLRAILAVQQENLIKMRTDFVPLSEEATRKLAEIINVTTIAALNIASEHTRNMNEDYVGPEELRNAYKEIQLNTQVEDESTKKSEVLVKDFAFLLKFIDGKIKSYKKFNNIDDKTRNVELLNRIESTYSGQMISEHTEKDEFIDYLIHNLYSFGLDVLLHSHAQAKNEERIVIDSELVNENIQKLFPHRVDDQESIFLFESLSPKEQLMIESVEFDSFRDFAIHWEVIKELYLKPHRSFQWQLDPFAAEVLAEAISVYGVVILKLTSAEIEYKKLNGLTQESLNHAVRILEKRKLLNEQFKLTEEEPEVILSSKGELTDLRKKLFTDVTSQVGITYVHGLTKWFSRWLKKIDKDGSVPIMVNTGGVAVEDINGDGLSDILFVGGSGNYLYINQGNGKFEDLSDQVELNHKTLNGAVGESRQVIIADFDNDGRQDILITYVDDIHRIYKNLGDLKFEDMTEVAQLGGNRHIGGPATVFDFDRDGLLDIYIGYYGYRMQENLTSKVIEQWDELFKANTPPDVRDAPRLLLNNDNAPANQLYRNEGAFKFKNVTKGSAVLANRGWTTAVSHTDVDLDGLQDIIISNDYGKNVILRNQGEGKFEDISQQLGVVETYHSMNVGVADLNRDQYPDIYFSNINTFNKDASYILPHKDMAQSTQIDDLMNLMFNGKSTLYLSKKKDGELKQYTINNDFYLGNSVVGWAWDADFFDYDNDGDDDLYVANGYNLGQFAKRMTSIKDEDGKVKIVEVPLKNKKAQYLTYMRKEPNLLFINQGNKLVSVGALSGADYQGYSSSAAYLDYDTDGDLDLVLVNTTGPAVFYRNDNPSKENRWLKIKLIGNVKKGSNRDAIGARVIIQPKKGLPITREVRGSTGYLSMHPKLIHTGLGTSKKASVKIFWPNGEVQQIKKLRSNRLHVIKQK